MKTIIFGLLLLIWFILSVILGIGTLGLVFLVIDWTYITNSLINALEKS